MDSPTEEKKEEKVEGTQASSEGTEAPPKGTEALPEGTEAPSEEKVGTGQDGSSEGSESPPPEKEERLEEEESQAEEGVTRKEEELAEKEKELEELQKLAGEKQKKGRENEILLEISHEKIVKVLKAGSTAVATGIKIIGKGAAILLGKTRLRAHVPLLRHKVDCLLTQLGGVIYDLHAQGEKDVLENENVKRIVGRINEINEEIKLIQERLEKPGIQDKSGEADAGTSGEKEITQKKKKKKK